MTPFTIEQKESLIQKVRRLKKERNAVIPAHYYELDEVKFVADYVGDSLELSRRSRETDADIIVFAGVGFMAETAKILNPTKKVLLPSLEAGCSLADSITADDVRKLKRQYPEAAVVTYINTNADVKAETDVCCTSANYLKILKAMPQKKIIFLPDKYMAANAKLQLAKEGIDKELITWDGKCIVHDQFTPQQIAQAKKQNPDLSFLLHIECPPKAIEYADFAGSTAGMLRYVEEHPERKNFYVLTECGMMSDLEKKFPDRTFETPCTICPYMKKITLENIAESLETGKHEIVIPEETRVKAYKALDRMLEMSK